MRKKPHKTEPKNDDQMALFSIDSNAETCHTEARKEPEKTVTHYEAQTIERLPVAPETPNYGQYCTCGHTRSAHIGVTCDYACCFCSCQRFTPDIKHATNQQENERFQA